MSKHLAISHAITRNVRDECLCLHVQRAARAMARRFDDVFRPLGITHGQFSLLNALNRKEPARMADVAALLGMDRTTLTAALKALERRAFAEISVDPDDGRGRRLLLTDAGHAVLAEALPIWKRTHRTIERTLGDTTPQALRRDLLTLSAVSPRSGERPPPSRRAGERDPRQLR